MEHPVADEHQQLPACALHCRPLEPAYLSNLGIASEAMGILKNRHRRGAAVANL